MEGGRKEMGEEKDAGQREEGRQTYSHLGKPRGFQGYMSEWEAQGLLEKGTAVGLCSQGTCWGTTHLCSDRKGN